MDVVQNCHVVNGAQRGLLYFERPWQMEEENRKNNIIK